MDWIAEYQLFLFDFDGLLVDTERLHHKAYVRMCADHEVQLPWSFERYCEYAHKSAEGLRDQLIAHYPQLGGMDHWPQRYAEKKQHLIRLFHEAPVPLMPGAAELLEELARRDLRRCVVTHSGRELINVIRAQQPLLQSIPVWFTREDYDQPKPAPDGYLRAISELGKEGDRVIGFEDTPRGLQALRGTPAQPVLVAALEYPEMPRWESEGVKCVRSLAELV